MNNHELGSEWPELFEKIGVSLNECSIWRELGYTTSFHSDSFMIELQLNCQETTPIINELGKNCFNRLKVIKIDINYQTPGEVLQISRLVDMINYLLLSSYLWLKDKYPLVFSINCRKMVSLNYPFIKRNVLEICDDLFAKAIKRSSCQISPEDLILSNITKLQNMATHQNCDIAVMNQINRTKFTKVVQPALGAAWKDEMALTREQRVFLIQKIREGLVKGAQNTFSTLKFIDYN